MAMNLVNEYTLGGMKAYVFNTASAGGTTETMQLPVGKRVLGVAPAITSATGRAPTNTYTASTGVLTIGAIVAADAINCTVFTD